MDGVTEASHPEVALLLNGNGTRDYEIWVASVQGVHRTSGRRLILGVDLMHNAEDDPGVDPMDPGSAEQFTFDNRDRNDGYVFSVHYGGGESDGDWQLGYFYARIETLAVNNSYAQDDWVRWGNATQTRGSDLQGHELRVVYHLGEKANLVGRLYIVDAITSDEDGNRFRLDLNITP